MRTIYKVAAFGEISKKGNQTIKLSVTKGIAKAPGNYFLLSTPEAIEAEGVKVGDDLTELVSGFTVETSEITDEETGEIISFKWLIPPID